MSEKKDKNEYFKKWQNIKLSDSSRARIKENLLEYAKFHGAAEQSVRVEEQSRFKEQVPQRTSFFTRFNFRTMPVVAIVAVLLVGGGTSFAAQGSVPGDLLYPIKTGFNENIRSTFALGADAEARLQAELLEERLEEAEQLAAEGRLEGELAMRLESSIERHAEAAESAEDEGESSVAVRSDSRVRVALERFNALLGNGGSLAVNNDSRIAMEADDSSAEVGTDMGMSTMMAVEEIPLEELREMTQRNIRNLRALIERYRAEIAADLRAELNAQLTEAEALMVRAEAQIEAEARQTIFTAADLAGKVEAALSTLGTVEIDPETGMIMEIDFSAPPVLDTPIEYRGEMDGGTSSGGSAGGSSGGGVDGNAGIEVDISDDMIEIKGDGEATSQINL